VNYPRDRAENLAFRARVISKAKNEPQFQRALYQCCKDDILFWFNVFLWTYDAKGDKFNSLGYSSPHMPFVTFIEYQDQYILDIVEAIEQGHDLLTEKSRDMGASWIVMAIFLWFWLFQGAGNDFLVGSRKQDYVDQKGNMSTLFQKLRYIIKRLPQWMLPVGYDVGKHDNYMRLENPESGSMIHGEANNDNFGTSGRAKACLMDEFSKWKHTDEQAWQSLSDVTDCKLPVSSAWGRTNHFYRLRAGEAGEIKIVRLHWSTHPLKDDAWYEAEKRRRSPADLAAEVDIDYSASVTNKAFPTFKHHIHCAEPVIYNEKAPIILCCDFNITPMSWALCQHNTGIDYFFDEHVSMQRMTTASHAEALFKKLTGHKHKHMFIYGDATGARGSVHSLKSNYEIIKTIANKYGWNIVVQVPRGQPGVQDRLEATNKRLEDYEHDGKSWVKIDPVKCKTIINSLEQTQRKDDGVDKSENVEHISEAIGYYFVYRFPIKKRGATSIKRY
jgi:hypothetical protein